MGFGDFLIPLDTLHIKYIPITAKKTERIAIAHAGNVLLEEDDCV